MCHMVIAIFSFIIGVCVDPLFEPSQVNSDCNFGCNLLEIEINYVIFLWRLIEKFF